MYYRMAIVKCGLCGNDHDFVFDELPRNPVSGAAIYGYICPDANQPGELHWRNSIAHVPLLAKPVGSVLVEYRGVTS
jgi:hypothetical protein